MYLYGTYICMYRAYLDLSFFINLQWMISEALSISVPEECVANTGKL